MPSNISPAQVQQAVSLMQILIGLGVLLPFIRIGITLWAARRSPSIAEELYKNYATTDDLEKLEQKFETTVKELFCRQHADNNAVNDKFQAILQSIGELKGQFKCNLKGDNS